MRFRLHEAEQHMRDVSILCKLSLELNGFRLWILQPHVGFFVEKREKKERNHLRRPLSSDKSHAEKRDYCITRPH